MPHAYWIRRDLRIHDNPALHHASLAQTGVVAVYLLCPSAFRKHQVGANQVQWLLDHLRDMQQNLAQYHIPLKILNITAMHHSASALKVFCEKHHIRTLYYNAQYEVDELARDKQVTEVLLKAKITVEAFEDRMLLNPHALKTGQGKPYTVFTPFKKAADACFHREGIPPPTPLPKRQVANNTSSSHVPTNLAGFEATADLGWCKMGEAAALNQLRRFTQERVARYHQERDTPSFEGTSRLSPYLAIGVLSAKLCAAALFRAYPRAPDALPKGPRTWLDELLWRDFYQCILVHFPRVCKNQPFNLKTANIPWGNRPVLLKAWQHGQTGFPLVDAAMRQLTQTGWMHNRLRMVTAMFLSKNCDVHWQLGEKFFSQHLVDLDFASNNGGWQWSASTGTDAAPYFRVFNPISQSQRFDPDGVFIKRYCPELKDLDPKHIHEPGKHRPRNYPAPILDHKATRQASIDKFKRCK